MQIVAIRLSVANPLRYTGFSLSLALAKSINAMMGRLEANPTIGCVDGGR
jgi:hypothetical protein